MSAFATPTVAYHGSSDPDAPLVVLLHGRGSHEQEIISLAPRLPEGVTYAAVRAPISEGGGFAWFANRGIGRPVASSLAETMSWFRTWLDEVAPAGRPVALVGFSGGAAFAGGLVLADPTRYAGAAILYGTLPFDAGVPVEPSQLIGTPVFVAQGDADHVIPRELLDRTWSYLLTESGAAVEARRDPGGHGLTPATLHHLAGWLHARLAFLTDAAVRSDVQQPSTWLDLPGGTLPSRTGARPEVSWAIPQQQLSDNAPRHLQDRLFDRLSALPGVASGPSRISVPGARGLTLPDGAGPDAAYLVPEAREFAHVHPEHDGSMHLALPPHLAAEVVTRGWGTPHPWAGSRLGAGFTLVFGPRDEAELEIVTAIAATSHACAAGTSVRTTS